MTGRPPIVDDTAVPSAPVTVTYYLEILSSWCHWAEPAWTELKQRYAGRVELRWAIALMRPEDFPVSTAQCDWFYRRSGLLTRSPYLLNSGWFEVDRQGHYEAPNHVAEAGRDFIGRDDDRIRLALTTAAVRHGARIGDLDTAVEIGARAASIDAAALRAAAESPAVRQRVADSTARFLAHQINQRPSFIIESAVGDKAVISGAWQAAPVAAAIDAQLHDFAGYAAHEAHFGGIPST